MDEFSLFPFMTYASANTNRPIATTQTNNNQWNRELTLKCKLKCYVKLMKDPLGVSSSKGNQGTTLTSLHIGHRRRDTYVLYVLECLAMEQLD